MHVSPRQAELQRAAFSKICLMMSNGTLIILTGCFFEALLGCAIAEIELLLLMILNGTPLELEELHDNGDCAS